MLLLNDLPIRTLRPMTGRAWKERVRAGLSKASDARLVSQVARDLEIDRGRLYGFVSRGYLDEFDVERVETWLKDHGFLTPTGTIEDTADPQVMFEGSDPIDAVILQVEGLLKLVRDKEKFDYTTRFALLKEGLAGIEKHIMPVAERWADKVKPV